MFSKLLVLRERGLALAAVLAASAEFFCGLALLFGVLTRLATIPLITTMLVAILTARRKDIDGVSSLLGLEELSYLTMFVWLALAGPGKASIDCSAPRQSSHGLSYFRL